MTNSQFTLRINRLEKPDRQELVTITSAPTPPFTPNSADILPAKFEAVPKGVPRLYVLADAATKQPSIPNWQGIIEDAATVAADGIGWETVAVVGVNVPILSMSAT